MAACPEPQNHAPPLGVVSRFGWADDIFGLEALHTQREIERKTKDKAI